MKLESFQAGTLQKHDDYQSFSPSTINREWTWDSADINTLLEEATRSLGELNAFSVIVPDIDLFIEMHIAKEASFSSRIEGTKTKVDEAVMAKEMLAPEKMDDWQEVQNYIQAMNFALEKLKDLPLSSRLLRETHAVLLQSGRGKQNTPGEFRKSQNWIGGSRPDNAVYVPPHHIKIPELMTDLETFWHNTDVRVPHLIRIAISHYQFETIHPFLDGNGRIGRLLIPLYLISHGLLIKPSLYLSDCLEKHRLDYFDALANTRRNSDLAQWARFFLVAMLETTQTGIHTFQAILELRTRLEAEVNKLGRRSKNARILLAHLYTKPVISALQISELLNITQKSARGLVNEFIKMGILIEHTGFMRNRSYTFSKYLSLF